MTESNLTHDEDFLAQTARPTLQETLKRTLNFLKSAPLESGVCCCGEPIEGHTYNDGHAPVDELAYTASNLAEDIRALIEEQEQSTELSFPVTLETAKKVMMKIPYKTFELRTREQVGIAFFDALQGYDLYTKTGDKDGSS